MREEAMPIIKLEIENIKHQICHYIGVENSDLEKAICNEIDRQQEYLNDQIRLEVSKCINEIIRKQVYDYFNIGEGSQAIRKAILELLTKDAR